MTPVVIILTCCIDPALAYGSLLVFDSLRTGYPDNEIVVVDNGSHPDVVPQIEVAAAACGCRFIGMERFDFVRHFDWILFGQDLWPSVVFLDPDVVFWQKMRLPDAPALLSGRLIPSFKKNNVQAMARLHPSHLYVPDVAALRAAVAAVPTWGFNPIGQSSAAIDGVLYSWDTCAPLYHAFKADCLLFGPEQLECYDHLFYGSHLPLIKSLTPEDAPARAHALVQQGRVDEIKGIWRAQDEYFARMA